MQLFGVKHPFFVVNNLGFLEITQIFVTIMAGHQKKNVLLLTLLRGGPRGGRRGPILAGNLHLFNATTI